MTLTRREVQRALQSTHATDRSLLEIITSATKRVCANGTVITESTSVTHLPKLNFSAADKLFVHHEYCRYRENATPPRTDNQIHRFLGGLMASNLEEHLHRMGLQYTADPEHNHTLTYAYALATGEWLRSQRDGWDDPDLLNSERIVLRAVTRAACALYQLNALTDGLDAMRINIPGFRAYQWVELLDDGYIWLVATDIRIELANPAAIEHLGLALLHRFRERAQDRLSKLRQEVRAVRRLLGACKERYYD